MAQRNTTGTFMSEYSNIGTQNPHASARLAAINHARKELIEVVDRVQEHYKETGFLPNGDFRYIDTYLGPDARKPIAEPDDSPYGKILHLLAKSLRDYWDFDSNVYKSYEAAKAAPSSPGGRNIFRFYEQHPRTKAFHLNNVIGISLDIFASRGGFDPSIKERVKLICGGDKLDNLFKLGISRVLLHEMCHHIDSKIRDTYIPLKNLPDWARKDYHPYLAEDKELFGAYDNFGCRLLTKLQDLEGFNDLPQPYHNAESVTRVTLSLYCQLERPSLDFLPSDFKDDTIRARPQQKKGGKGGARKGRSEETRKRGVRMGGRGR